MQRRFPFAVLRIDFHAVVHQELQHRVLVSLRGPVQRGVVPLVHGIDASSLRDIVADDSQLAFVGGLENGIGRREHTRSEQSARQVTE